MIDRHTSRHGTVMAVSMMKDEAPFLLEWFAHHLAVGLTDILVYTNDCTDGTVEMLQRLEELGLGHHRHNVIAEGQKPQPSALNHAQAEPLVAAADWVLVFDADEFLCINHPSGHLDGMLDDTVARGANGIVITWRTFGSGFVQDWSPAPVTEQYLYAAPPQWRMGWGVKTLFKFDPEYWKLGIHRPSIRNKHLEDGFPDSVHWLNGSGQPMEDYFKFRGWRSIRRTVGYDWAQMNHYAVKSIDSYALRKLRGNVNNKKDKYNADYWSLQDRNEVRDEAILRHAPRRAEIMAALLQDPVLNRLHHAALDRVAQRLADHKQTEAYATMKAGLIEAGKVPITQVAAKPPQPRDPLKIAALMSRVEQKNADRPADQRRNPTPAAFADPEAGHFQPAPIDLSADVAVQMVANRDLTLPVDLRVFTPATLERVCEGKYERRAGRYIAAQAQGAQRLLDCTGGFGFVAMLAAMADPQLQVMVQQDRADLVGFGKRVAAQNGLTDRIRFANGPLVMAGDDATSGPRGLRHCLADFRPDMLRLACDAVDPGWMAALDLSMLSRILLVPAATGAIADAKAGTGAEAATGQALADWVAALTTAGFAAPGGDGNGDSVLLRRGG